jgi:hypothetical protein
MEMFVVKKRMHLGFRVLNEDRNFNPDLVLMSHLSSNDPPLSSDSVPSFFWYKS